MKAVRLFCSIIVLSFYAACVPDECGDVLCDNGGVCVFGSCSCLNGYEGPNCDTVWRDRFLGDWNVAAAYGNDTPDIFYSVSVESTGFPDQFLVNELGHDYDSVLCRRVSPFGFVIDDQDIDSVYSIHSGSGFLSAGFDSVNAAYTLSIGDSSVRYRMIWTR
jgi:hypothetical protein